MKEDLLKSGAIIQRDQETYAVAPHIPGGFIDMEGRPCIVTGAVERVLRPGGLTLTERAVKKCGFSRNAEILDIGCGCGTTLRYLTDCLGRRVYGLDIATQMLSECRDMSVLRADAAVLPFRDTCLDGIFCECVLSLLPRSMDALREFRRILRTGGHLVLGDLYRRNSLSENMWTGTSATCMSGAKSCAEMMIQLDKSGFDIVSWEDHSWHLKVFAARMVWALGSRDLWMQRLVPGMGAAERQQLVQHACFGYGVWIARPKG